MEIWTPSTWFLGPTPVLNPNSISIVSAVFAGLTSVTDRQTTLLPSVTIGCIYICSTAMQPNNVNNRAVLHEGKLLLSRIKITRVIIWLNMNRI